MPEMLSYAVKINYLDRRLGDSPASIALQDRILKVLTKALVRIALSVRF